MPVSEEQPKNEQGVKKTIHQLHLKLRILRKIRRNKLYLNIRGTKKKGQDKDRIKR